jgi:hypothetical protein
MIMFEEVGIPKDEFDENAVEKEAEGEDVNESLANNNIDDQTIIDIIEIFAEEKEGFYYGRQDRIGSRADCIEWVKSILRRQLE